MSFLTKNGKLVTKGGKFVRTDNPAACDCCGGPPPPDCAGVTDDFGNSLGQTGDTIDIYFRYSNDNSTVDGPCIFVWDPYVVKGCGCDPTKDQVEAALGQTLDQKYGTPDTHLPPFDPVAPCDLPSPMVTGVYINRWKFKKVGSVPCKPPPEYTTPGWYAHCVAAELTDGSGNGTGLVQYSSQRSYFYSSMPRFPVDLGDGDYAMKILAGPFGTIQEADAWILANGGVDKDCVDAGSPIRPPAARLPDNPLP